MNETVPSPQRNRRTAAGRGAFPLRSLLVFASLALLLSSCRPNQDKADAYEALYDREMAVQAYPAALLTIQRALKYDDTTARRYLKLAEVQMALGRPAMAAGAFQAALDLEPANVEALQNLAVLAARGGQFDMAQRYIDPLLALSPNDPAGLLASGVMALGQRHFDDALAIADKIIAASPDRSEGYLLKARALDAAGRTREALALLEKRIPVAADPKDLLLQAMTLYRGIGDLRGIRSTALRLAPLFPDDPRYALESARAYAAQGKPDQVRAITDDLIKRFPHSADVLLAIGRLWRDTQPLPTARVEIGKLAARSPPQVRSALANQLIDLGDPQQALALLAPLAPAEVTTANLDFQARYARALLAAGRPADARAKVDAALDFDGGNSQALLVRARLKLAAHDYRGAVTDAQLVTSDDDQNEEAALLVAQIYAAQGNQLLAAGAFGNARQKFRDSFAVLRAEVEWLMGQQRTEEAAQRVAAFRRDHPRSGDAESLYQGICRKTHAAACGYGVPSVQKMLS